MRIKVIYDFTKPKDTLKKAIAVSAGMFSQSLNDSQLIGSLINPADREYKQLIERSNNYKILYDKLTELDEDNIITFNSAYEFLGFIKKFKSLDENIDSILNNLRFFTEKREENCRKRFQP